MALTRSALRFALPCMCGGPPGKLRAVEAVKPWVRSLDRLPNEGWLPADPPLLPNLIDTDQRRSLLLASLWLIARRRHRGARSGAPHAANQSAAIFGGGTVEVLPIVLVYLTPFVVVTVSQVLGIRRALLDAGRDRASVVPRDAFLATAISRGIPLRSFLLGLIVGTVNTSIVISAALMDGGNLADLPTALIGQAFVLPMLFGLVSQAISYRRAAAAFSAVS